MNWEFIIKYLPMYERAALLTVKLGLAGVICAIIVGLICAIIQYEKVPVARQIVAQLDILFHMPYQWRNYLRYMFVLILKRMELSHIEARVIRA